MRNERRSRNYKEEYGGKKTWYIAGSIIAVAIIAFIVTFIAYGNKMDAETKMGQLNTNIMDNYSQNSTLEETSTQFGRTVNEMNNKVEEEETNANETTNEITKYSVNTSSTENKIDTNTTDTNTSKTNKKSENTTTEKTNSKQETITQEPEFTQPVEGEISKEFAKDKLVYSNTLGEWVTHNGIDIKAAKTTVVKSAEKGTVKSIKNDPRYGLTVVIEHDSGYQTIYSNLLTAEFVVAGEKVEKGQTIGTVGNTATFEITDEPHLHFEILKDGEYVDPQLYLK